MKSTTLSASEAARALGSIKTPKKSAASAANIAGANPLKPLAQIACNCDGGDSPNRKDHKHTCPRYRAIYYREKKGLPVK